MTGFRQAGVFLLSKSTVLLSPFIAATLLSRSDYGLVEWWLSLAMVIGPLLGVGASGVIAYGTLGGQARRYVGAASLYIVMLCTLIVFVLLFLVVFCGHANNFHVFSPVLMCCCVMQQMAISSRLKALNRGAWASLAECGLYISLLLALLVNDFTGLLSKSLFYSLLFTILIGMGVLIRLSLNVKKLRLCVLRIPGFLRVGVNYLVGGAVMAFFMATPRIYLGWVESPLAVADFSLVFRWLSISIIIHQFVSTLFFRFIYTAEPSRRAKVISYVVLCVGLACFSLSGIVMLRPFETAGVPYPNVDYMIIWTMSLVMVLWAATASLEGVLLRADSALSQIWSVVIGLGVTVLALWMIYWFDLVQLISVSLAWLLGFIFMIGVQLHFANIKSQLIRPVQIVVMAFLAIYCLGVVILEVCR